MMEKGSPDERVLVLAPIGQDAEAIAELLTRHRIESHVCRSPADCVQFMKAGAGALLLTEEALELEQPFHLLETLKSQPTWSELPLIVLTTGGQSRLTRLLESVAQAAGSVTLLERPIASLTLLRSIEVALNSRRRQYQVRDLLIEQRRNADRLRELYARLGDHARELEHLVELRTAKLAESNQQLRREIQEREEAERAREELRRQLGRAQEEERRRIARELHDQMGQNLTALNFGLRSLGESKPSGKSIPELIRPLQELAAQTARDLHRVALELRPAALDDLVLVKALGQLIETWAQHCQIEADFEPGNYDSGGILPEVEDTLYRVIQEALNNIAKHDGAAHVSIVLSRRPGQVQAIVEDDGVGFDVAAKFEAADGRGRLGLVGMKERLSGIDGKLQIESSPGAGTTLTIRAPIVTQK
jgi:signal transduction histidine kinase